MDQYFITAQEYAKLMDLAYSTVLRQLRRGALFGVKRGGKWLVSPPGVKWETVGEFTKRHNAIVELFANPIKITNASVQAWLRLGKLVGVKANGKWFVAAGQAIPVRWRFLRNVPHEQRRKPLGYALYEDALNYVEPIGVNWEIYRRREDGLYGIAITGSALEEQGSDF